MLNQGSLIESTAEIQRNSARDKHHNVSTNSVKHNNQNFMFNIENLNNSRHAVEQSLDLITEALSKSKKPFTGIQPHELAKQVTPIQLDTPKENLEDVLTELNDIYLKDAVYFHHTRYMAHLNCPIVYPAICAELILSSINSSLDTWDQSAGGTLIEQKLIDWTTDKIGFSTEADGIFTSGGTQSNLMALLLSRDNICRDLGHDVREYGLSLLAGKLRIFASELSHFSVQKSAAILGLGYQAVTSIPVDSEYRMDQGELEKAIIASQSKGEIPIAVVATAGTTDLGSIDPLLEVAQLCQQHKLWMHVDAAYGCGLLVTDKYRDKLIGIEQADSVTVDYHKSFFQPVSCSAFLVKNKSTLSTVTHHAEYLNPLSQQREGTPNLVSKSIQTTRRFDALKLWLSLRIMGPAQLGEMFSHVVTLAQQAHKLLSDHPEIEVLTRPQLSTLIFRFNPQKFRGDIDQLNENIRKHIFRNGEAVIASTRVHQTKYLKFTLLNPQTQISDIEAVIDIILRHGRQLSKAENI